MDPIVDIILDGEQYAARNWKIIPRVGDLVALKDGEVFAEVKKVVWGDDSACRHAERQRIYLVCQTTTYP